MGNVLDLSEWKRENELDRIMFESLWLVKPMQGRSIEINLHRTRYNIKSASRTFFCEKSSTLNLFSKIEFEYTLEFAFPDKSYSRLLLRQENGPAFFVNGVEAERVYLHAGDKVTIGCHHFYFPKITSKNKIDKVADLALEIIQSKLPIFLQGETGTGKTALARKIHQDSGVVGPFVHLNLSSLSANLFESELFGFKKGAFTGANQDKRGVLLEAHKGTLFLDEINSLTTEMQTKLLLVLESKLIRPIGGSVESVSDFRLITSSNEDLIELVESGRMRKDFYFRITSGEKVTLPQLNSSENYFYKILNGLEIELDLTVPRSLKDFYYGVRWEGNIRELKNYLQKKRVLQGRVLSYCMNDEKLILKNYAPEMKKKFKVDEMKTLEQLKKDYTKVIFERCGRSVSEVSRVLKIAPGTVRAILYEARM